MTGIANEGIFRNLLNEIKRNQLDSEQMQERMDYLFERLFFLALMLTTCLITCQTTPDNTLTYPTWLNSSQTEYNQFLTDKYNYFITPKGNKIWTCVMNLAWNELKEEILNGQNATFFNLNTLQTHMVENLNAEIFTKNQLSQDSYYVHSGYGQQTVNRINFDVKQKFPLRTLPQLKDKLNPLDFISFAYLFKKFQFPTPFADNTGLKFKNVSVRAFEAKNSKQKKQLYYKYYNNTKDFMLGVTLKNSSDQILFWKTNITKFNQMRMEKFIQIFNIFYKLQSKPLTQVDKFICPVIDLDFTRSYNDLIQSQFTNPGFKEYKISKMQQRIKLRITKQGVVLQAQGVVIGLRSMSLTSKMFYLDDTFWVVMKQKNKQPYLVSLVNAVNQVWVE